MKEERIEFYSKGQKVHGILQIPDAKSSVAVIIAHGYGGFIFERRFELLSTELCRSGCAVLRLIFRGYNVKTGERSKKDFKNLTIHGEVSDLKAAIDFMYKIGYKKLGFASESLGGNIFILLSDSRIKVAALWSANIHLKSAIERVYNKEMIRDLEEKGRAFYTSHTTGKKYEVKREFWDEVKKLGDNHESKIKEIKCPMLIIQGTNDEYFSTQVSQDLYKLANEPKKLLIIEGANHTFTHSEHERQLINAVSIWFKKYLN